MLADDAARLLLSIEYKPDYTIDLDTSNPAAWVLTVSYRALDARQGRPFMYHTKVTHRFVLPETLRIRCTEFELQRWVVYRFADLERREMLEWLSFDGRRFGGVA